MLAKSMADMADTIQSNLEAGFDYSVQAKLNGVRMVADRHGLWSRNGNRFDAPDVWERCSGIFKDFPDLILDGEWFSYENRGNLAQTLSQIRVNPEGLQFHVFDTIESKPFSERLKTLRGLKSLGVMASCNDDPVQLVRTYDLKSYDQMIEEITCAVADGMEGIMVRRNSSLYEQGKRSNSLVKCKIWHDCEFEVECLGFNDDGVPVKAVLLNNDGATFMANIQGSNRYWVDASKNFTGPCVGTVRFLIASNGVPINPILTSLRNYE